MGPQSCEKPNCENFGTLGTKWYLGAGPMAKHKIYYMGEGGDFPQIEAMMNFANLSLPMARPNIKSVPTMH